MTTAEIFWLWLSRFSDLLSFASGLLGLFVFLEVRKLKKELTRRGRIGPLREDLATRAAEIQELLRDVADSQNEIPVRLAQAESTLLAIAKIVDKKSGAEIILLSQDMRKSRTETLSEGELRRIYAEMMHLAENLKQTQEEMKWQT